MPILAQPKPIVAIVGRPNVGKSTLFNRLSGRRIANVEPTPGVTRDRLYADCEWFGHPFVLIDTGGIQLDKAAFTEEIRQQVDFAINEANVILFLVDGRDGMTHIDYDIAEILRRTGKPLVLVVNKVESKRREEEATEFYALGLGEPFTISALHGQDVDFMLDRVVELLPPPPEVVDDDEEEERLHVAIVGRPNVGKSSLLNAIINEERAIVSDIAGTTRDALDIHYDWDGTPFTFIDTAGIRRKSKVEEDVEYYSVVRAFGAIDRCDVVIMMIDATEGVTDQDKRIAGYAHENGRGLVIAVNKWDERLNITRREMDLTDGGQVGTKERQALVKEFTDSVRYELIFANYAPVVFISALKHKGVEELLRTVTEVAEQHAMRIPTGELNRLIAEATFERPVSRRGKMLKIYYVTQVRVKPPTFVLFVNDPELVHFSIERYLENQIRQRFSLEGTPVRIKVKESSGKEEAETKPRRRSHRERS
ncbi:MAG: ribosome biogenesis GTPase Der [Gammaproteobacteria bacterium]|nr:ribosome biogenesis GTPase Der [Gammaproteobacteria bacterium]